MADLLRSADVDELLQHRDGPCASMFLPTHRTAPKSDQDPIRLKNLLTEAEEQLVALGMRAPEARDCIAPGRELLDDGAFWSHQSDGLALFMAPGWSRRFRLAIELPEIVVVSERFHLKPLLALLSADHRFFVLALSQNEVRLFEGSRQRMEEVEIPDAPADLGELRSDDAERERSFHTAGRGAPVVFHGHGIGGEVDKRMLERFLGRVDDGLREILREERSPLVLAGVGRLRAMFRAVSRYPHVLEDGVDGNPETLRPEELHERATAVLEPVVAREIHEAADRYRQAAGRGEGAASDVVDVVRAAEEGRVDTLFVPLAEQRWGTVDPKTLTVSVHPEPHPGDEDLLDRAAVRALLTSGTVYAVAVDDIPGPGPAAALLRY